MTEEQKVLATSAGSALARGESLGMGFEEAIDPREVKMPRAMLLQPTSRPLSLGIAGLSAGMYVNSITHHVLPQRFIPITKFTTWVRFNPRKPDARGFDPKFEPGAVIWRSNDPRDPRVIAEGQWEEGPNGQQLPPIATQYMNFLAYFPGSGIPLVLGFAKTSARAGRDFFTMCLTQRSKDRPNMPDWAYALKSIRQEGPEGIYFEMEVAADGAASQEERDIAYAMHDQYAGMVKHIKVVEDEAAEPAPAPATQVFSEREPGTEG